MTTSPTRLSSHFRDKLTTGLGRHSNGTEYQTMFFTTTFLIPPCGNAVDRQNVVSRLHSVLSHNPSHFLETNHETRAETLPSDFAFIYRQILFLDILHVIICVDPRYVSNARSAPAGFLFGKCSLSGHSYSPPFPPPKPVLREHVSFSGIRKRVKNIRFGTTIPKEQSTKPCFSRQLSDLS